MKRNTLLAGVVVGATLASPVAAQEYYVGISGGASLAERSDNRGSFTATVPATADYPAIPAGAPLGWQTKFDTGFNISGTAGVRLTSGIRFEAEFAYSQNGVDRHRGLTAGGTSLDAVGISALTRTPRVAGEPTVAQLLSTDPGKVRNLGAFANAFYDFSLGSAFRPYVGAGAGVQRTRVDYRPSNVRVARDSDTRFAYQLMAGASYAVGERAELYAQYSWRKNSGRARVPLTLLPANLGVESGQSIIGAGVRFRFN